MWHHHKIAVVIPAYQEEILLPVTLKSLPPWLDAVIVVDDASQDQTAQVAHSMRSALHAIPEYHVISCDQNGGVGKAICIGYQKAYELQMDIAVVMGADAQMDAAEMPRLLEACILGADYVKGERFSHPHVRTHMPTVRYWGNKVLSYVTGRIIDFPQLKDAQCGYTAIRVEVLESIDLHTLYPRYGFPNDLLFKLAECHAQIIQVPVTPIYGDEKSKLSIPKVIVPILGVLLRGYINTFKFKSRHPNKLLKVRNKIKIKESK